MRIIQNNINLIDTELQNYPWLDMSILKYENSNLSIIGSISESYPYEIELLFKSVHHISAKESWKTDTSKQVLSIVIDKEFNIKNNIEIGYNVYEILAEDIISAIRITAKDVELRINREAKK